MISRKMRVTEKYWIFPHRANVSYTFVSQLYFADLSEVEIMIIIDLVCQQLTYGKKVDMRTVTKQLQWLIWVISKYCSVASFGANVTIKIFNFFLTFFRARIRRNSEYTLKVQTQPAVLSASKSDRCLQKDGVSCYEYLFVFMNTEYISYVNVYFQ